MEITLSNKSHLSLSDKINKLFNSLFSYDEEKLTIYGDEECLVLNKLNYAFLNREIILLTFNDQHQEVVTIKKIISDNNLVVATKINGIQEIIRISDIFNIEFAD